MLAGMTRIASFLLVLGAVLLPGAAEPAAADARSAAVLAVTLIDSSTEGDYSGPRADETARVAMLRERLAAAFADKGWRVVDIAPVAADLERVTNPAHCNGCDSRLARRLGADVAVTAEVQKVSNLILTINIFLRDSQSGDLIRVGNADIRSNTDRSWKRGLDYILRNRIFPGLAARASD